MTESKLIFEKCLFFLKYYYAYVAISTCRVGEVSPVRYSTNTFAYPLVVLAESAIDCCAVNGLLISHLPHKLFLSRNKVNLEIVRFLLLYRGVCSPSMQQHLTKILL